MTKTLRMTLAVIAGLTMVTVLHATPRPYVSTDAGTIYLGAVADSDWGRPLTSGDFDDDGYDDVVVAASESYGGVMSYVCVVRGGPGAHGAGTIDLSIVSADQVIAGAELNDNLGSSMAAGDVNGDGVDDLLLCASSADFSGVVDRGVAYLIYGGATFFSSPTRDLSASGSWDMRFIGPAAYGDMGGGSAFGGLDAHAATIGDINGDTLGDVILGVHLMDGGPSQAGRVYVVFGRNLPSGYTFNLALSSWYDVRVDGNGQYDNLGECVLTGDLTGDGIEELIIPSHYASQGLFTSEGAVHIFRGRATWNQVYSLVTTTADIRLLGDQVYDELGSAAAVGDFNGDGITDLIAAAPGADAGTFNDQRGDGFVYGLLGSTVYQTDTHTIDYASSTPDFLLIGEFEENLGDEVCAGDFNGDGVYDIAACERFGGPSTNGVVEVLLGRDFAPGETHTANVDTDARIVGLANDRIGFWLSAADSNNDGVDEVFFSTPFNNADYGTAYLFTYVTADGDYDRDTDLLDFAVMQRCCTGALVKALGGGCPMFDFDLDEDIDGEDLAAFDPLMVGPGW
ncbi:MAG: FG-GAP repeat protein [Phycisphaerae bacterium]|nr:FG-GAP repeat protein [Phycisphaerae bacterium]